ncbi:olfactory receptor 6C74 [Alligator mississippiensis]|uniref:Olfactory receptor n=1 Tax=Alligator mississippiensis TaxID=8496 RepID=A0A151NVC4_ALLMI|nr:olfactory receptor 6C74 [Alligator mississippiensis]KYO40683.1 olfactory receptor 6C74-like [Alligator mississippiensis]
MENQTRVTEFILVGFTDNHWLQILLFFSLLFTYLLTVLGNLLIIVITLLDQRLQTPMYFLLRNFSLLEITLTSISVPKVLFSLASGSKTISVPGCFAQCFLYVITGTAEFFMLAAMSFDRYVAICKPLHYPSIMNNQLCTQLVLGSWVISVLYVSTPFVMFFQLPFCGPNIIDHFFCDSVPVIKLACIDTQYLQLLSVILATGSVLGTFIITIISYINIISTVMHIPSVSGRQKAFSTCVSHLTVVFIFYGSCIFMYVTPSGSSKGNFGKTVALLNNVVSPLLSPFIYSLRNKQVKDALRDAISRNGIFCKKPKL